MNENNFVFTRQQMRQELEMQKVFMGAGSPKAKTISMIHSNFLSILSIIKTNLLANSPNALTNT